MHVYSLQNDCIAKVKAPPIADIYFCFQASFDLENLFYFDQLDCELLNSLVIIIIL